MALKKQILIVEDNKINQEMLRVILEEQYSVIEAENGQKALTLLWKYKNDIALILLDVTMPVMDGYTFRRARPRRYRLCAQALPPSDYPAPGREPDQPAGKRSDGQSASLRPPDRAVQ